MNRRDRRAHQRRRHPLAKAIDALLAASHADGRPWSIHGLTDSCADCDATAVIRGHPGTGLIWADITHNDHCPAYRGITPWHVG